MRLLPPVAGASNEMFSDFEMHVVGVPQIAPLPGRARNVISTDRARRLRSEQLTQCRRSLQFRTSPLRNVALQPAFFHNGAFTRLEDAVRHHLDVFESALNYDAHDAGVDHDLRHRLGPIWPVLARIDPLLATPIDLSALEFSALVAFVRKGLLDERAKREILCQLVPSSVPSAFPTMRFEGCQGDDQD